MSELEKNQEQAPLPTYGELIEQVLEDPQTRTTHGFGARKLLGTGEEKWRRQLWLQGWQGFIDPQYQWGGTLTLTRNHSARYLLGKLRESSDEYTLRYSHTDSDGRTEHTLFDHSIDVNESASPGSEITKLE